MDQLVAANSYIRGILEMILGKEKVAGIKMMTKIDPIFALMQEVCFQYLEMQLKLKDRKK